MPSVSPLFVQFLLQRRLLFYVRVVTTLGTNDIVEVIRDGGLGLQDLKAWRVDGDVAFVVVTLHLGGIGTPSAPLNFTP